MTIFTPCKRWLFIALLLLANVGFICWVWFDTADIRFAAKEFKFANYYTNGVACIVIQEAKTRKPLLTSWDFGDGIKPGEMSYFFQGTNILNIYLTKNHPPTYKFIFHGLEKSEVWWFNMGGGESFNERASYDTNGNLSNFEILYDNTWYTTEKRNGKNGIIVNSQWHQLTSDTNGMLTIEAPTNAP
jgi:hypothetical protein